MQNQKRYLKAMLGVVAVGLAGVMLAPQSAEAQGQGGGWGEQQATPSGGGGAPSGGGGMAAGGSSRAKDATRFIGGFHLGAGGDLSEPAPGVHLRFDFPLADYFALSAPMAQLGFIDANKDFLYLDAGLMPRGRYAVDVNPNVTIDVYAGLPVGFSLFRFQTVAFSGPFGGGSTETSTEYGWHVGLMFGAQVFFNDSIGGMVELGWLRHDPSSVDGDASTNQMALNVGVAFLL